MEPVLVDERDTKWESDTTNLRVFIHRPGWFISAYDVDDATLGEVEAWAQGVEGAIGYQIAQRVVLPDAGPGLVWLVDRAPAPPAREGPDPTPAIATGFAED